MGADRMDVALGIILAAFCLFLIWNGRGHMGSERFARRYPLAAAIHVELEHRRSLCSGAGDCLSDQHVHGCLAEHGRCDRPEEHAWT